MMLILKIEENQVLFDLMCGAASLPQPRPQPSGSATVIFNSNNNATCHFSCLFFKQGFPQRR